MNHFQKSLVLVLGLSFAASPSIVQSAAQIPEYVGDHPELILASSQAWGELGLNTAAHAPGQAAVPLRILDKSYAKGLGHHANGSITVLLGGEFSAFDAEVGIQPCDGGSVIFRVYVDGSRRFDSGLLRSTNTACTLHVDLSGAQELRLEASDGGDGISCDMANWADARLTPAAQETVASRKQSVRGVDIAPFGRIVTWDANRTNGTTASRIEEFRAEDLFTETELARDKKGNYVVPAAAGGLACAGVQWLSRRAIQEMRLTFSLNTQLPPANFARVEAWFGESAWQGSWKPIAGDLEATDHEWVFRPSRKAGVLQTYKCRWIFTASKAVTLSGVAAFTRSRWSTGSFVVELDQTKVPSKVQFRVINGEFADSGDRYLRLWNHHEPARLRIRFSEPTMLKSDPTVLQVLLPKRTFAVGIQDVLSNDCVYLPDAGVFIARDPAPITLAAYKQNIAGRKTLLEEVRSLPDQTFAQAMAKTHHEPQREGPVMLSLACDNTKFVLERDGRIRFPTTTTPEKDWFATAGEIRPRFGTGNANLTRSLEGGWLPIPVITREENGLVCQQRTFVAPADEPGVNPTRLNRLSVCVAEFTLTNTLASAQNATLALAFHSNPRTGEPVQIPENPAPLFEVSRNLKASIQSSGASGLGLQASNGLVSITGSLPPLSAAKVTVFLADSRLNTLPRQNANELRSDFRAYWTEELAPAMQVETPEPMLNDLIRSSQIRCLIAARNESDGDRIAPWIAAMSYGPLESESHSVIRGMDFMGHSEFARRGLEFFIHRYNPSGYLTTGYTTFGTAWHIWTVAEHYELSGDQQWLEHAAPELCRVGDWITRQTAKTLSASPRSRSPNHPPAEGLMPPGVMADWNAFAYHYCLNAYYYAALHGLGTSLRNLADCGMPASQPGLRLNLLEHAKLYESRAADLRARILQAYEWTQSQSPALPLRNGSWIQHYPSQVHSPGNLGDFFPGQDAGRSWCYDVELGAHQLIPTGVLPVQSRETQRMLEHMEDVQFLSDGWFDYAGADNEKDWFDLGGFSKVQPYYCRNCEIYALRDDVKPFVRSYFNTLAAMLNPEVMTFWEHFRHSGAWDKTHETGYFLHQTRTMLLTEHGNDLWLAPLITDQWLLNGKSLTVRKAPSKFGPVDYRIESRVDTDQILATIEPPTRSRPGELVLRLRHPAGKPIRSVLVNGRKHSRFDNASQLIRFSRPTQRLDVIVAY
jgi:hypothetical protein